jgi:hypothetical protein
MRARIAIVVGLTLLVGHAAAAPLVLSKGAAFFESFRDKAQISGPPVVGVLSIGAEAIRASPLTAAIPADWRGGEVCARVVSSDGLYEARGQYVVPDEWAGGIAEFDFPTGYGGKVLDIPVASMAVLISRGDCDVSSPQLALAAWRTEPGGEALILVNSYRSDETYLVFPHSGTDSECVSNPSPQRTAFDMICTIPQDLVAGGGEIAIEVNRVRRGGMVPPDLLSLVLP